MAPSDKVRMNVQVSAEVSNLIDTIADQTGSNRSDIIRQAIALMKVAHDTKKKGRHLGIVADPTRLDTEIIGLI